MNFIVYLKSELLTSFNLHSPMP